MLQFCDPDVHSWDDKVKTNAEVRSACKWIERQIELYEDEVFTKSVDASNAANWADPTKWG